MNFKDEAKKKFKAGAEEHKTDWIKQVDPVIEAQNECLDLYNYASHPALSKYLISDIIKSQAERLWVALKKIEEIR